MVRGLVTSVDNVRTWQLLTEIAFALDSMKKIYTSHIYMLKESWISSTAESCHYSITSNQNVRERKRRSELGICWRPVSYKTHKPHLRVCPSISMLLLPSPLYNL